MSDLLIKNCSVLQLNNDGTGAEILTDRDILIRGNLIEAVQATALADESHFRTCIDAKGMLAMPGLINTHAHVPMVLFRGLAEDVPLERWLNDCIWPIERYLSEEDVYWAMLLGAIEMIEAGVTAVADHYFYMDSAASAVEKVGIRANLGWAMFDWMGESIIERTSAFVRQWQGAALGRIRTMMAPHAPYTCNDDFLRATVKAAEKLGVGIHIHVSETKEQTSASLVSRGLTPIQILEQTGVLGVPTILAHACGATPDDIKILARYPTGIASATKTYLKLGMDLTPVSEFRQAGIPVGLATDGAASNNTLDLWESLRLLAMAEKLRWGNPEVLPVAEAISIATVESARVFSRVEKLGKLASGYLADLILIDLGKVHLQPDRNILANLVYSVRPEDVQTTIVDGQIVMRSRQILTVDKAEVIARVRSILKRLTLRQKES
ncbi:MAG: amidohydrolase [Prochloraceae cyanobacterium]|nr:amidohydrolase [Prochloraceae cyanobacterium]